MFKKSLAAVAVLGAFAATSFAADVTLYGKVDMGVQYKNTETTAFNGVEENKDAFTLDSGVGSASRIGLKATEDLGNGYKVSFKLEKGFKVDGTPEGSDRFFDRESSLSLSSGWGTVMAGRFGSFSAAASATDIVMSRVDSFDGGHTGAELVMLGKMDNAIAYLSPKVAGFQAAAMYSFKNDNTAKGGKIAEYGDNWNNVEGVIGNEEGHHTADHYAGLALTYDIGALQTALSYEQVIRQSGGVVYQENSQDPTSFVTGQQPYDDARIVTFGGNYDFDLFKLYAAGQYFEGMTDVIGFEDADYTPDLDAKGIKGYGLHVGTNFDALGGHFGAAVYYVDAEADLIGAQDADGQYFGVAGRYVYDLSKRTNICTTLAYNQQTWDKVGKFDAAKNNSDFEKNTYVAKVSLTHNF